MTGMELLSPGEVTERYGISASHLNHLVRAGWIWPTIDSGRPGVARYYSPEVIEAYLASRDNRGKRLPSVG